MMRFRTMTKLALVIAALGVSSQASAELVSNGSFEAGDFSGWTQSGNTAYDGVQGYFFPEYPTDGYYQAFFGAVGSLGGISQTLSTVAGQSYNITFDLANDLGVAPTEYKIQFGSTVLADAFNPQPFAYTSFSFFATATSASTALSFAFQNDPSWFLLDNVSVSAVPEAEEWAMLAAGVPLVGWQIRRKQTKALA